MKKIIHFFILFLFISSLSLAQRITTEQKSYKCPKDNHNSYSKSKSSYDNLLNNYDIKFYKLDIAADNLSTDVEGSVTINAIVENTPLDTFVLELIAENIVDSVYINGTKTNFSRNGDYILVLLSSTIAIDGNISAQIFYKSSYESGSQNGFDSGIMNETLFGSNKSTYTLSEPFKAKVWWPCKQVLTDKADSAYIFVTTSSNCKVGSNGLLDTVVSLPNSKVRYEWKTKYPIAYYLISIAIGEYTEQKTYAKPEGLQDSILIQNYILPNYQFILFIFGLDNNIDTALNDTKELVELFSDLYSMYPFKDEKYGHCMSYSLMGGMEHQTMTTMGVVGFEFGLIAHELGHQWFGDNVTCATWQDVWINEGFASYTEYLAYQYLKSQAAADDWMKDTHDTIKESPGGSVYVPLLYANDNDRIFSNRLSYKKGAALVHMIRFELDNDTMFFDILKEFQTQYKDSVATGLDFKNLLESISGRDFTDFFDQWYYGEGYPIFDIDWNYANDTLTIISTQTTSTVTTTFFKMPMEYRFTFSGGGDTTIRLTQNHNVDVLKMYFPNPVISINVDPDNWMLKELNSVTGISENVYDKYFACYPNPFNETLNFRFINDNAERTITIYNLTGNIVLEQKLNNNQSKLNTSQLKNGVYFIKLSDSKNTIIRKLIKQ